MQINAFNINFCSLTINLQDKCSLIFLNFFTAPLKPPPQDPCYPSPCGANAQCRIRDGVAYCECIHEFHGDPYSGCRPECVLNNDCTKNLACIQTKCVDPCPGVCGQEALCTVTNHIPICSCPAGFTGDAFRLCYSEPRDIPVDPCNPSPCGRGAICRISNQAAVCQCTPGTFGDPFVECKPECTINSECSRDKACVNSKCIDPCPGVCGYQALCNVINHSPICSCPRNMIGDPFTECKIPPKPVDPCLPSPCGPNGICKVINNVASCTYPECVTNPDCHPTKVCINQRCSDPCIGSCGINAICTVVNHQHKCSCPPGYVGSPYERCVVQFDQPPPIPRPECISDDECTYDKACINEKCLNPCIDGARSCGINSECRVQAHRPICVCRDGFTGNGINGCYESKSPVLNAF